MNPDAEYLRNIHRDIALTREVLAGYSSAEPLTLLERGALDAATLYLRVAHENLVWVAEQRQGIVAHAGMLDGQK